MTKFKFQVKFKYNLTGLELPWASVSEPMLGGSTIISYTRPNIVDRNKVRLSKPIECIKNCLKKPTKTQIKIWQICLSSSLENLGNDCDQ